MVWRTFSLGLRHPLGFSMWSKEAGSAEPTYEDYRYRRYGYDTNDDDADHEMGEVFDESLSAEHFSDPSGRRLDFGRMPLHEDEIVSDVPLGKGKPDREDFEGYTGNAGMTLERWYHRAAVLLWPVDARFDVLCDAGVEAAVGGLKQMVGKWKKTKKREQAALREECLAFARRIMDRWPAQPYAHRYHSDNPSTDALLPLLHKLDDASLVSTWIRSVLAKDVGVDPGESLGDVCARHGWLTFQDDLQALFRNTTNETIERHARLLADWSLRKGRQADRQVGHDVLVAHPLRQTPNVGERIGGVGVGPHPAAADSRSAHGRVHGEDGLEARGRVGGEKDLLVVVEGRMVVNAHGEVLHSGAAMQGAPPSAVRNSCSVRGAQLVPA